MSENFGVNYAGFFKTNTGLGKAAEGNIEALKKVNIPFQIIDFEFNFREKILFENNEIKYLKNKYSINIIHINPNVLDSFLFVKEKTFLDAKYNIAYWAWEISEFPEKYVKYLRYFDEVWTPSSYCVEIISKKSPIPVIKIPHAVEIDLSLIKNSTITKEKIIGTKKDSFLFMFFFDYGSLLERKNTLNLIRVFNDSFSKRDDVFLLIKTGSSKNHQDAQRKLHNLAKINPSIILLEERLSDEDLYSLLNLCDCYISLHKSEGFGLSIAEAMYLGKPVITTGYSGNMDFTNINNSLLVKYQLEVLKEDIGDFPSGAFWANPDLNDATLKMKTILENEKIRKELARHGEIFIKKNHSYQRVGELIYERLNSINLFFNSDLESNKQKIKYLEIQNLNMKTKIKYLEKNLYTKLRMSINRYFYKKKKK